MGVFAARSRGWGVIALAAAVLSSCECSEGPLAQPDAQVSLEPRDAGGEVDAGSSVDAGAFDDAGADAGLDDAGAPDAGFDDAGAPDAGPDADAGPADAGTDAGTDGGMDAGIDAGVPVDAGAFDAGGLRLDAGLIIDAGFIPFDGGVVFVDAGSAFDGGGVDGPVVYVGSRTHSPIDLSVVQRLRAIAARGSGRAGVFAKVGDSISTSEAGVGGGQFLNCLDGELEGTSPWDINVRLGAWGGLSPTIDFFQQTRLGADDSWTRASLATRVGAFASWALSGSPSPLERELAALNPRYAVVMFGSNDIGYFGEDPYPLANQLEAFESDMRNITDELLERGVIPLLTTMPPDLDSRWARFTPAFSGVVRAIAQGRQVPLIDYQRELRLIGYPYGLASDGTHPTCAAWNGCCWFDPSGLRHGYNVRNLITLQAFDRMRQVFGPATPVIDPLVERLQGAGTTAAPFVVTTVPFGELRALRTAAGRASGSLTCGSQPAVPVSGPQVLYQLVLTRPTAVRVLLLDEGARAHRISLLASPSGASCVRTASRLLTATLPAGTWYLQVNTQTSSLPSVDYNLSVTECVAGDPDC